LDKLVFAYLSTPNQNLIVINKPNKIKMLCESHSQEMITNYCSITECKKLLCPECVREHNWWHK